MPRIIFCNWKQRDKIASRLSFFLCFFLACLQIACSQTAYLTKKTAEGKAKRLYERGYEYNKNGLWEKAIKDYTAAIEQAPNFIDAHYQLAAIYYNQKRYQEASKGLKKVIEIDSLYKPQAYYYLGFISWQKDKFEKAAHYFDKFLNSKSKSTALRSKAESYLKNCHFAATALKNPVPFDPRPLSSIINTPYPEYLPSITAEGNTLVFTRRVRGQEDVFFSKKEQNEWQMPLPLEGINTPDNEGSQYISADGSLLVFVKCSDRSGYGSCDLYFSEKKGDSWTKPQNMGQPINTRAWESQPSLSADGRTLYFASSRKGSLGGRDIWRSQRNEAGEWSNPVNLGRRINTLADDEAPFFHPDNQSLYFMSKGHPGMGGYDLFLSKKEASGRWGIPQNLGYPINTKGNEGALFITLDGMTAYFAKDHLPEAATEKINSRKQPDIYAFELPEKWRPNPVTYAKAKVKDALSLKNIVAAKVEVIDLVSGEIFTTAKTDSHGNFLTCLPMGGNYALNIHKEKYFFHSENFELLEKSSLRAPFLLEIALQPIPDSDKPFAIKTQPIILKNVFFESGSAELKAVSLSELDRLKELLVENPNLNIQINGHTDSIGSESDNLQLSENRAEAVKNYLVEQGIHPSRLQHKGFGESQPIDTNETETGRKNNRRTTFVLID